MTVPVHGLPPVMRVGMRVAIVPPALRGDRWHLVTSVSEGASSGQLVSLSGVSSIGDAEGIVGKTVLALVDELPADIALHDAGGLLAREVWDEGLGSLGTIVEVMTGPANDVWVISGSRGEILVPVIPSVVSTVPEDGPIIISVPTGMGPKEGE